MNCPQKWANTITQYGVTGENLYGSYDGDPRIDLMRVVMIRLPKDDELEKAGNKATKLHEMLITILSTIIQPEEKLMRMEKDFKIEITEEIVQEVNDMCNYSDVIENKGAERGYDKVLFRTLSATLFSNLPQIKRRYSIKQLSAFSSRLFYEVPSLCYHIERCN